MTKGNSITLKERGCNPGQWCVLQVDSRFSSPKLLFDKTVKLRKIRPITKTWALIQKEKREASCLFVCCRWFTKAVYMTTKSRLDWPNEIGLYTCFRYPAEKTRGRRATESKTWLQLWKCNQDCTLSQQVGAAPLPLGGEQWVFVTILEVLLQDTSVQKTWHNETRQFVNVSLVLIIIPQNYPTVNHSLMFTWNFTSTWLTESATYTQNLPLWTNDKICHCWLLDNTIELVDFAELFFFCWRSSTTLNDTELDLHSVNMAAREHYLDEAHAVFSLPLTLKIIFSIHCWRRKHLEFKLSPNKQVPVCLPCCNT